MRPSAAVIGVGYLGRFHAQKYGMIPDVELKFVCDSNSEQAQKVASEVQCQPLSDYRQMKGQVQLATVAATTSRHFEIAKWCLENEISVLLEKPMTSTVAEAEELCQLAKQNNLVLQIGFIERFNKTYQKVQELVPQPLCIDVQRLHPYTPRGADVSVVLDLMIHDLDSVMAWVKSPLKDVKAQGAKIFSTTHDMVQARLEFESGCVANLTCGRTHQVATRKLRAWASGRYVSADLATNKIHCVDQTSLTAEKKVVPSLEFQNEKSDGLLEETRAFVHSFLHKKPALVTGEDGLRVQKLCDEIIRKVSSLNP